MTCNMYAPFISMSERAILGREMYSPLLKDDVDNVSHDHFVK